LSGALRPPPYRPRPKEGEPDREAPLSEDQLRVRSSVIRTILVTLGVGAYGGFVLFLRELPGGGLPYYFPLSMIPSVVLWLIVLVLALVWSGQKGQIRTLLIALTLVAVTSLAGVLIEYNANPQFWWRDFYMRFD
jgi:hypothetical protein